MADTVLARTAPQRSLSGRTALLIYVVLFLALTFPFWLFGETLAPYQLTSEIGAANTTASTRIENRKFSDYWHFYIPEITSHLKAPRSGWLALWTSADELGRPLYHLSGHSPAYAPTWVMMKLTHNPERLLSMLSLSDCFLAGLFVLLLCSELGLVPLAGLLAGGSFAAAPYLMYWLTFSTYLASFCWSAGILYALTRLARRPDLPGCSLLAFCAYSLFMTGYPQVTVIHGFIVAGYLLRLSYRRWVSTDVATTVRYLAIVALSVGIGGLLTLPVYLELPRQVVESAGRAAPDVSFYSALLPVVHSFMQAARFLVLSTFPQSLGNPISPTYPFPFLGEQPSPLSDTYDGFSVTPLLIFFAVIAALCCIRKTWGWWLAIAALGALAFVHPLHEFAVRYLGFNISRTNPITSTLLPLVMIAAYGADALIRQSQSRMAAVTVAALFTLACLFVAVWFASAVGAEIQWRAIIVALVIIGLLAANARTIRPIALIAALAVAGAFISFPMMLRQPPSELTAATPSLKKVIDNVSADSRFAVVGPDIRLLLPNLNAIFGVASVHSYDTLSSRRYQQLIGQLGGTVEPYGRWNATITPDYSSEAFWMSNISLVLSPTKLDQPNLESVGEEPGINFYRVHSPMGCCLQITSSVRTTEDGVELPDWKTMEARPAAKVADQGDLLEFELQSGQNSLLLLSQQYNSDWRAEVRTASSWLQARAVPVNGAFQGVILPAEAQAVRLQFLPFVRFAWLGHVFWLVVLIVLAAHSLHSRMSRRDGQKSLMVSR